VDQGNRNQSADCHADRIVAADARTVLWPADKKETDLPRSAIRPYPTQYMSQWSLQKGMPVTIRPIRPEDEPLLVHFHEELSDRSVMFRYFHPMHLSQRTAHERLIRVCFNDYDRELALVAEGRRPENGERFILGIGRLSKEPSGAEAEFSIVISDAWQKQGLGTQLLKLLLQIARDEKIGHLTGMVMAQNLEMQHIAEKLGFKLTRDLAESAVRASIQL
jgi:acetyltransferase